MIERGVEHLRVLGKAPGDEAAADARIAGGSEFPCDPFGVAIAATKDAEPAGLGDRGREHAVRHDIHRREQHRMLDAEQRRDAGRDGHVELTTNEVNAG